MGFQSDLLLIFTVHEENPKYDIQYIYSPMQFLLGSFSEVCHTRKCKEGRFIKYNTTRCTIQLATIICKGAAMILLGGPDPARRP